MCGHCGTGCVHLAGLALGCDGGLFRAALGDVAREAALATS